MNTLKNRFYSIRFKIIALFSLLVLFLFITVSLVFYKSIDATIRKSTEKEYRIITDETANKIERFLFERYGDIQVLANNSIFHNSHIPLHVKEDYLDKVREAYNTYDYIVLIDKNSNLLISSGTLPEKTDFKHIFDKTKSLKVFVSNINKENNQYGMYFCASVFDEKGMFYGVIIERMNMNSILEIKKKVKTAKNGFAFLMNEQKQFLFIDDISDQFFIPDRSDSGIQYVNYKGDDFIYVYKKIKLYSTQGEKWFFVLKNYKREAFSVLQQIWNYTLMVILISVIAISVLIFLVANLISRPFKKLVQEAEMLAKGEHIKSIDLERKDEIGAIAGSLNTIILNLNTMTEQILETSGQAVDIKEMKDYLGKLTNEVSTGILTLNAKGHIISVNNAAIDLLKVKSKDIVGFDIFSNENSSLNDLISILKDCFEHQKEYRKEIISLQDQHGNSKQFLISSSFQKDKNGRLIGLIVIFRKMDEFIRFEESVTRAKTLNALGLMSAGIAHEIRNPLTSIKGYAQYVKSAIGQNHELQKDLDIIISEVNRLNHLINRFLDFAKPVKPEFRSTKINHLIFNTIHLINQESSHKKDIILDLKEETSLNIDEDQIVQALINLLLNAIQSIDDKGRIKVRTYFDGSQFFVIHIEDNGCGIKAEDADHLFEPFFTTKDKGSGLGLAICARIMKDHNGQIEYHPGKDKGTVFLMKFPVSMITQENK
jgi:nitrogen fixation/metabolism regulation signal transduction histidine kinase